MNLRMRWDYFCWLGLLALNFFELNSAHQNKTSLKTDHQDFINAPHVFSINRKLYEVSRIKADWFFAKIECSLKGMDLLSIETWEEQEEVVAQISEYGESFWTSGSDNEQNNYFYWESTGHAFGHYYNWGSGQPDDGAIFNSTDQNCMLLNHTDSYTWYDLGCTADQLRFVCEERGPPLNINFTFEQSYYEVSAQKLDWWRANYVCKSKDMMLANIQSELEHEAIRQALNGNQGTVEMWIGGTDLGREGDFYWDGTGDFFGPYSAWGVGQPDNAKGREHCVHMLRNALTWNNQACSYRYRYLCEGKIDEEFEPKADIRHGNGYNGETGFTFAVGNSSYEISVYKADWFLAKVECQIKGMELLSIETQEEQDAIAILLNGFDEHFWTSGNKPHNKYAFTWDSTGHTMQPAKYVNWATGQPNSEAGKNDCVILNSTDSSKWYAFGCTADKFRFICERKESRLDETTTFSFGNITYELSPITDNWWNANRDCRSKGMQLMSIKTKDVAIAIQENLGGIAGMYVWIAANDLGSEEDFYWDSTGELVGAYTSWAPNRPTESSEVNINDCVLLKSDAEALGGQWYDSNCTNIANYVCEK